MDMNLMLATGLAYVFLGGIILLVSKRAFDQKASRPVAENPQGLPALRAQRYEALIGVILIACGSGLVILAAFGHVLSPLYATYLALVAAAVLCVYGASQLRSMWRVQLMRGRTAKGPAYFPVYETRRSVTLLVAARREAGNVRLRDLAKGPRDRNVVYLARDWECRWWCDKLGVSPDDLKAAVRQVGPMSQDIERHLRTATPRMPRTVTS